MGKKNYKAQLSCERKITYRSLKDAEKGIESFFAAKGLFLKWYTCCNCKLYHLTKNKQTRKIYRTRKAEAWAKEYAAKCQRRPTSTFCAPKPKKGELGYRRR